MGNITAVVLNVVKKLMAGEWSAMSIVCAGIVAVCAVAIAIMLIMIIVLYIKMGIEDIRYKN